MVYKLSPPDSRNKWSLLVWMLVRTGAVVLLVSVLVLRCWLELSWPVVAVLSAVAVTSAVLLCYWQASGAWRQMQGDTFVTITEAGIMREIPHLNQKVYTAWQEVRRVKLVGAFLLVQMKDDLVWLLPLNNMSPMQRADMCRGCQKYVGSVVPPEKQVQPPACLQSETPRVQQSSVAARAEAADYLILRQQSVLHWLCLILMSMMLTATSVLVVESVLLDDWTCISPGVVCVVVFFMSLQSYLHPGRKMQRWIHSGKTSEVHVTPEYVMVVSPGTSWAVVPKDSVSEAVDARYSYLYGVRGGGIFAVGKEAGPLTSLVQPQRPRRRWGRVLFILVLVPVVTWAALAYWAFSGREVNDDDYPGSELAAYVEKMTPVHGFPGRLSYCSVYLLETEHKDKEVLIAGWENGISVEMISDLPDESAQSDN